MIQINYEYDSNLVTLFDEITFYILLNLQISIHEYRERNSVVARTINELHQEVSDALEERIALEYQLEQLKSFGD
jgi:RNAse (barnase) inhibitor barstar